MVEVLLLITLIILGISTVSTDNLRRTVIYSGAFSLTMALAYLYYNAPDVALAEAAIGVGLSTIMYLVALTKVRVYSICYVDDRVEEFDDADIEPVQASIVRPLEYFLERTEELEPQLSYTNNSLAEVLDKKHELVIYIREGLTYLYGDSDDLVFQDIVANLTTTFDDVEDIRVVFRDQEVNARD